MTLFQAIKDEFSAAFGRARRPIAHYVSASGAAKRPPTKVERMLLIAAAAQLIAGPGKNPTREQLAAAKRGVDRKLAGTSASGSWSSGSFWNKVTSLAKQAGGAAVRAAPAATKWVGKNPQIFLPIATGAIASPFLISAITAASKSKQAATEAASSPPPPPEGEVVAAVAPSTSDAPPEAEESESMGLWQGWDENRMHGELSEEEIALGECGGASERAALMRTHSVLEGAISHDAYRASVLHNARRLAGGSPQTKDIFKAEKMVKNKLNRSGISVQIPGASPGRRTL
jgi:hypothetical protein